MEQEIKNLGFNLEQERQDSQDADWILGADTPKSQWEEAVGLVSASFAWTNPDKNGIYQRALASINHCWCFFQEQLAKYFPVGQLQNLGGEKYNCVPNGFNNEGEKQLNYAYEKKLLSVGFCEFLHKYNFFHEGKIRLSNRIPAIGVGIKKGSGTSLKAVVQWIHEHGIFPQSLFPEDVPMTFEEYYDKSIITSDILAIGEESKKYITINYAKVYESSGDYYKLAGNFKWKIFDNYKDAHDGDFIKQLAPDYEILDYGYKLIINETGYAPAKKKDIILLKKFQTDPKVYLQSNTNEKELIWVGNEKTFEFMRDKGWVGNWSDIEILDDSLRPNYDISSGVVIVNYLLNALVNLLGCEK